MGGNAQVLVTAGKAWSAAALLALAAACSAPEAPSDDGSNGPLNMPELASANPSFVSLNPCVDAILIEVADPEQILALSHYSLDPNSSSIDPAQAREYAVTGGTVEEVAALNPDMVLASEFIAPPSRAALTDLGFLIEPFGIASDPEQSFAQITRLAELTGHPQRGEELIAKIKLALADAAPPTGFDAATAVLWQPGQIVPGEATLVSHLMRETGFSNHSAARGFGQADYVSLEGLLSDPPQLVLVAGNSAGQTHPLLKELTRTQVEAFDPKLLYCAGPTIIQAAERLSEIRENLSSKAYQ